MLDNPIEQVLEPVTHDLGGFKVHRRAAGVPGAAAEFIPLPDQPVTVRYP